jgi:hypothetical protein
MVEKKDSQLESFLKSLSEKKNIIPQKIKELSWNYEAWIVGGSARYLLGLEDSCKDWDVLIPFNRWGEACRTIPKGTPANSFGGFKLNVEDCEIDVWAGEIGWFLGHCNSFGKRTLAVNLEYGIILDAFYIK